MRHDLRLDGLGFRLRPVEAADAAFIVELRGDGRAAGRLHPISPHVEDQLAWLESYFERPGDRYWIVERIGSDVREGTIGLYLLDETAGAAEWGRWILRPGSLAAAESVLLLYRAAFEVLGLRELRCRTAASNAPVLSFHDRCGLDRVGLLPAAFLLGDTPTDAVEHRLTRERWPTVAAMLAARAAQAASLLERGAA